MRMKRVLTAVSGVLLAATTALAQDRSVFVTPIANAPFMAVVTERRTSHQPDGTLIQLKSLHAIARNSAGAIYNEGRPLIPADFPGEPTVTVSHVYDPQTRLNTLIYPSEKMYQQHRMARPPATEPPGLFAAPEASTLPESQFSREKDLGTKTMEGMSVHGVLITQKQPSPDSGAPDVEVTDEYWYSADLRLNMLIKHDDPRSGTATVTVTQVSRTEPNESIFTIPAGYKRLGMPAPGSR